MQETRRSLPQVELRPPNFYFFEKKSPLISEDKGSDFLKFQKGSAEASMNVSSLNMYGFCNQVGIVRTQHIQKVQYTRNHQVKISMNISVSASMYVHLTLLVCILYSPFVIGFQILLKIFAMRLRLDIK